jgi:hypothetical protein
MGKIRIRDEKNSYPGSGITSRIRNTIYYNKMIKVKNNSVFLKRDEALPIGTKSVVSAASVKRGHHPENQSPSAAPKRPKVS